MLEPKMIPIDWLQSQYLVAIVSNWQGTRDNCSVPKAEQCAEFN